MPVHKLFAKLRAMPWFSYHGGHSGQFCAHAKGSLEDVVLAAIRRGFTHYGLSEHCPRDFPEHLYPDELELGTSGLQQRFDDYMAEARRLQIKYDGQIELLVGFETERLPSDGWARRMQELRTRYQADFIVGSVHDVEGHWIDFNPETTAKAAEAVGGLEALQCKYFAALTELVVTLKPEIVGHLDLVRKFDGPGAHFGPAAIKAATTTLEAVRSVGAVLDVNPGAARRGYSPVYPLPKLLNLAQQMNVGVTLGDDGHGAHDVGSGLHDCMAAIAEAGYQQLHYLARNSGQPEMRTVAIADVQPDA